MRAFSYRRRIITALAVLVPAGMLALLGSPAASAATCESWTGTQPPNPGTSENGLFSTTVLSPCNAWAVGFSAGGGVSRTLIEHWTGAAWTVVPSPNPGNATNFLGGIRAVSPSNIWAVGSYSDNTSINSKALILHWDGHSWSQFENPDPGKSTELNAVRAVSASDVWAVGSFDTSAATQALILHWNGSGWKQVPSPHPGTVSDLFGVSASSRGNAWAVGDFVGNHEKNLILHWNGTSWKQVASPHPGIRDTLNGISVTSAANAWAVGFSSNGNADQTLILRWNGKKWLRVASPDLGGPRSDNFLNDVTATSAGLAWAVGSAGSGVADKTLILRWNGKKWLRVASPEPGLSNDLAGVAAGSPTNVWAVGTSTGGPVGQTLAVHCC